MTAWTHDHGPDELYDKYTVMSNRSREVITGTNEFIFVLRPEFDEAACLALFAYAGAVEERSPNLAKEVREKVQGIYDSLTKTDGDAESNPGIQ